MPGDHPAGECIFCGCESVTRYFAVGRPVVAVCFRCAVEVLPQILADTAQAGRERPPSEAFLRAGQVIAMAEAFYWKVIAARAGRG
jgi:hypothetical protein